MANDRHGMLVHESYDAVIQDTGITISDLLKNFLAE